MSDYADNLKKSIVTTQGRITQMIHDDNEQTNAMNRADIIRMAREADSGFEGGPDADGTLVDSLVGLDAIERFAALVAAEKDKEIDALRAALTKQPEQKPVEAIRFPDSYTDPILLHGHPQKR